MNNCCVYKSSPIDQIDYRTRKFPTFTVILYLLVSSNVQQLTNVSLCQKNSWVHRITYAHYKFVVLDMQGQR